MDQRKEAEESGATEPDVTYGLRGKSFLVTGGSRGLGYAAARLLAAEGASLAICGRDPDTLVRASSELRKDFDAQVVTGSVDALAPDELEDFTRQAGSALGGLDGLVANIGGKRGGGLLDSTREDWQATWELNGGHAVRTVRSALDSLRPGSSVVIVASISGWKPRFPAQYGAAKASEIYLAGALCQELAPYGVRVNTVSPGSILLPGKSWDRLRRRDPEAYEAYAERNPGGRLLNAEEVARVITFLLSPASAAVNGAHIPVDGGQPQAGPGTVPGRQRGGGHVSG
ncbi:SDR family NAD(P)-dependent oxidoreductase [Streptomyces lunaelactis]|uniref:SDR family NAD(P)-dependent oxidoreductase n=1 Tax=Streptomyces lunaelactis TaxID=1535768 RepID=UPI001585722B|nr:SDR family oxidoreductase [Streptomyces lunaelactis]NUK01015.1 SDR family oxidoreductase [Streptomyces lunaelactis]NUK16908.1 SDR family oxidoreductase [Streptomyces lunaelactis]